MADFTILRDTLYTISGIHKIVGSIILAMLAARVEDLPIE
jgi:hypothetical protein